MGMDHLPSPTALLAGVPDRGVPPRPGSMPPRRVLCGVLGATENNKVSLQESINAVQGHSPCAIVAGGKQSVKGCQRCWR